MDFFREKAARIQGCYFYLFSQLIPIHSDDYKLCLFLFNFIFHNRLFLSLLTLGIIKMFVLSNEDNAGECIGKQIGIINLGFSLPLIASQVLGKLDLLSATSRAKTKSSLRLKYTIYSY